MTEWFGWHQLYKICSITEQKICVYYLVICDLIASSSLNLCCL